MTMWKGFLAGTLVLSYMFSGHAEGIFRVDAASTAATPDGQSWPTAYKTLQAGVDAANAAAGGEVWVQTGIYTSATDPVVTMKSGVSLYGGFAGAESARIERNWAANVTIIDGKNARRCVAGANDSVLDGFTATRGSTSDGGGGMYNYYASPTVTNCAFTHCSAAVNSGGGAMLNDHSSPELTNCAFAGNSGHFGGGALANAYSSPKLTNCTFNGNSASGMGGGAMLNYTASPTLKNCILWGDTASSQPEIYNVNTDSTPLVTSSCIQGGYAGSGNISVDPLFVDAQGACTQLKLGSPCIDTGTAAGAPATDILGVARPRGAGIDMGAYEGSVAPVDMILRTAVEFAGAAVSSSN